MYLLPAVKHAALTFLGATLHNQWVSLVYFCVEGEITDEALQRENTRLHIYLVYSYLLIMIQIILSYFKLWLSEFVRVPFSFWYFDMSEVALPGLV